MDKEAAKRIQSSSDKTGKNQGFKGRAQAAADRNSKRGTAPPPPAPGRGK